MERLREKNNYCLLKEMCTNWFFKDCKYLSWRFWNYGTDISVLGVTPVKWRKVIERITET